MFSRRDFLKRFAGGLAGAVALPVVARLPQAEAVEGTVEWVELTELEPLKEAEYTTSGTSFIDYDAPITSADEEIIEALVQKYGEVPTFDPDTSYLWKSSDYGANWEPFSLSSE